jgi:hypothetical protein
MTRFSIHALFAGTAAFAVVTGPQVAVAADPTLSDCIGANESALQARAEHKLRQARAQSLVCAADSCPGEMREQCRQRVAQLNAAIPTLVFAVQNTSGTDLGAVRVSMDGALIADRLEGTAISLDPGEHKFTFEIAGQPPIEKTLILREGEKDRREEVKFGTAPSQKDQQAGGTPPPPQSTISPPSPPSASAESTPANPDSTKQTGGMGTQRILGITATGVGAAGLVVGGVFGLLTASAISKQKSDCPSAANCPNYLQAASDHSTSTTDGTVSTVAVVAGGALVAGGLALFFTAHGGTAEPFATGLVLLPSVGPGAGGMLLRGEF